MESGTIIKSNVSLPKDLIVHIASFIRSSQAFLKYIVTTCTERDENDRVILFKQLEKQLRDRKEDIAYRRRSREKTYYYVDLCWYIYEDKKMYQRKVFKYVPEINRVVSDNYAKYTLHEDFVPLLSFLSSCDYLYYVEDGNGHINGRFYTFSGQGRGMVLVCKFKESKIVGNVYMREPRQEELRILPLDDPSLHKLSCNELFNRLRKFEYKTKEQKKEAAILRIMNGEEFILKD